MALFALNLLISPLFAAEIRVNIDRNPVNLNESFQITFSASDKPDGEPDFSPLEKDFEILNQAQQQSTQIINTQMSKSIQWVLTVMAKRAGTLMVPVINFGQDSSQFAALVVNKGQAIENSNEDLFLHVEVSNPRPYIQEQVIYTLKLYRKVNISQAALTEPKLANAVIEKLGEDKNYNSQYQSDNYVVTERKYAIFPQKSETMRIEPLMLTADVIVASQPRYNGFFNRQNTRTQRVSSKAITLEVQAKPAAAANKYWLPAEQVYLEEKWSADIAQMKVGEPITRTLSLLVKGTTQGALPELYADNMPDHLKAYPDQPTLKETAKDDSMIAYREEKVALIPGAAGTYTLPAIEIPWWNTTTQKMAVARIAEQTLTALAVSDTNKPITPTPNVVLETAAPITVDNSAAATITDPVDQSLWFWLAIFFAGAWLVTLIYFLSQKNKLTPKKAVLVATEKTRAVDKILKKACKNNQPRQAKEVLIEWGREQFNQSSLTKIAEQCAPALQSEILALNELLYGEKSKQWQGAPLWFAFKENQPITTKQATGTEPLPPLYKIQ
ncbi:MAG: protein BatD [Methyloprofundus sp.]|nr:protein BatD [Methyloprofundus sp.]MBW6452509.1 BatD family protein [Methyloprofundus sp.]